MYDNIRKAAIRTRQFVSDHPTVTACAITGIVSYRVGRNVSISKVGKQVAEITEMTYQLGFKTGQCEVLLEDAYQFIKEQGLESEFVEFANIPLVA